MHERESGDSREIDCAFFGRPCLGERVSGDTAVVGQRDGVIFTAIVDGLGHGPEAHAVARKSEDFLRTSWSPDVVATMRGLHEELKGTRGAVAGLGALDIAAGTLRYTGVGNTTLRRFGPRTAHLYSVEGIVGDRIRDPVEQTLDLAGSDVVVLHTDGVQERFKAEEYRPLLYQSARSAARNIVHHFGKTYDDATCIVLRYKR